MPRLPPLDWKTSPLLRRAIAEDRFHVTDYLGEGSYDGFRPEKDEVERRVAELGRHLHNGDMDLDIVERDLGHMIPPDEIAAARANGSVGRLLAFAALQHELGSALDVLEDRSLSAPSAEDPTFVRHPDLLEALDPRDHLLPLTAQLVAEERLGAEAIAAWKGDALFPHPHLAPMRELVWELRDLAAQGAVQVSIAVHPFRITAVEEIQHRLLEDYWSGIRLTPANLDSLDRHDVGVPAFHAPVGRSATNEFFFPLLGTWFDWAARNDNKSDPVKRLYVREVRPVADRRGDPLVAADNRELHAERDTKARRFIHVDGKLRRYPRETYDPSTADPRAGFGSHSHSKKLWRVDGPLTDEQWCNLVGLYFRGNELIEEHFKAAFPAFAGSGPA